MEESQANNDALVDAHEAQFLSAAPKPTHARSCPRCGNFVRALLPGLDACEPCAEKLLPEGARGPLSFSTTLSGAGHLIRRIGPMAIVITLAFDLPGSVFFAFSPEMPFQAHSLYGLFTLVGDLLIMSMAYDALLGRPVSMKEAFSRATSHYGAVFRALWISNIVSLIGLILLIVPGVYVALTTFLAAPIALLETRGGIEAFTASRERTKGHWFLSAGTFGLSVALGFGVAVFIGIVSGVAMELEREATGAAVTSIDPWLPYVSIAADLSLNLFMLLALFFQMVIYTKTWLTLQTNLALDEPVVAHAEPVRGVRDSLDDKLDAELAKLDDR